VKRDDRIESLRFVIARSVSDEAIQFSKGWIASLRSQ
jgi:hypothetical protein